MCSQIALCKLLDVKNCEKLPLDLGTDWVASECQNRTNLLKFNLSVKVICSHVFQVCCRLQYESHSWSFFRWCSNKDLQLHFFSERVLNRWNQLGLPFNIVEATSVNSFNRGLQKFYTCRLSYGHWCVLEELQGHLKTSPWLRWLIR